MTPDPLVAAAGGASLAELSFIVLWLRRHGRRA
jgi:hypothetical protein